MPVRAPYFDGCDLLIAADCTAYAYGSFHADFIRGRVTLIGCPKLDTADYEEKLTAILTENDVRSVMLTRMEVPVLRRTEYAARQAIAHSGRAPSPARRDDQRGRPDPAGADNISTVRQTTQTGTPARPTLAAPGFTLFRSEF